MRYSRPLMVSSKRWTVTGSQHSSAATGGASERSHEGASTCSKARRIAASAAKKFSRRVRMSTSFPPFIHMFSTGRFRRALFAAVFCCCCGAAVVRADQRRPTRRSIACFCTTASTLLSYGEFARVADRSSMSLPLGTARPPAPAEHSRRHGGLGEDRRLRRFGARDALRGHARPGRLRPAERGRVARADRHRPDARIPLGRSRWRSRRGRTSCAGSPSTSATAPSASRSWRRCSTTVIAETRAAGRARELRSRASSPTWPRRRRCRCCRRRRCEESVEQALRAAVLAPDATERTSLLRAIERALAEAARRRASWTPPYAARVSGGARDRGAREPRLRGADARRRCGAPSATPARPT